jgi:hypothetical protein
MKYLMNCILLFILFTEIFSSNPIKPKFCRDCKFFTKDFFTINKFGKCSLFPKDEDEDNTYFLVDGIKPTKKLYFCSTARVYKDMCGPEGTLYVKK